MMLRKKRKSLRWELKVTSPDGTILETTMDEALEALWRQGDRTNDGYTELCREGRVHVWVKPAGYSEPDRSQLLDGTSALPDAWPQGRYYR